MTEEGRLETDGTTDRKDRIVFGVFVAYVVLLAIATIGELFDIEAILRIFDVKRYFAR